MTFTSSIGDRMYVSMSDFGTGGYVGRVVDVGRSGSDVMLYDRNTVLSLSVQ